MVCGLVIVLVMMILLSVSRQIYSHFSYRQIIRELNYAFNKCPRKHAAHRGDRPAAARAQRWQCRPAGRARSRAPFSRTAETRAGRGRRLPLQIPALHRAPNTLRCIRSGHGRWDGRRAGPDRNTAAPALDDPARAAEVAKKLKFEVERLQESADAIPDFQEGIPATLDKASGESSSRIFGSSPGRPGSPWSSFAG